MFTFNKAISTVLVSAILVVSLQGQAQASPQLDATLNKLINQSNKLDDNSNLRKELSAKIYTLQSAEYNRIGTLIKKLEEKKASLSKNPRFDATQLSNKIKALQLKRIKYTPDCGG